MSFHFVAHRGTSPENTMMAFRKCVELGVSIECDVRKSKDGIPVVVHDESLLRTTGLSQYVNEMYSAELRDVGIPLLHEVVALVRSGSTTLFVEVKENDDVLTQKTMDIIRENDMLDRCAIISFHTPVLAMVKRLSTIRTGYIHGASSTGSVDECGADMLWMDHNMISGHVVQTHGAKGVEVFAWTVNDVASLERLKVLGVRGIVSDVLEFLL